MAIADDAGKLIGRVNPQKGMVCTREDEDLTHEVVEHPTGGRGRDELIRKAEEQTRVRWLVKMWA